MTATDDLLKNNAQYAQGFVTALGAPPALGTDDTHKLLGLKNVIQRPIYAQGFAGPRRPDGAPPALGMAVVACMDARLDTHKLLGRRFLPQEGLTPT